MDSNLTNIVADELVNEILESALDIATKVSDSALKWRSFTETNEVDNERIDVDTCNKSPQLNEITEGLGKIRVENSNKESDESVPLAAEVKKLLNEMMSPPYEIVNYDKAPIKGGVGDQPPKRTEKEHQERVPEPPQIEKKSRVTDLIKNSKQILSEYIMKEKTKPIQDKLEETQEEFLQVIELECVKPGDKPFKAQRKYIPEDVPLPNEEDEEEIEEVIRVQPDDNTMEVVNLPQKTPEERNSSSSEDAQGGKGDEFNNYNMIVVLSPNENAHLNEGESPSTVNVVTEESTDVLKDAVKQTKDKKKWNLGSRLFGLFKKQPKAQQVEMKN